MTKLQTVLERTATYQTILGQPAEIRRLLNEPAQLDLVNNAANLLRGARRVFLVGTGTSFHAAQQGQFLLRKVGLDAWAVPAFDFVLYPQPISNEDIIIIFSHRGTKKFTGHPLAFRIMAKGRKEPSRKPAIAGSNQSRKPAIPGWGRITGGPPLTPSVNTYCFAMPSKNFTAFGSGSRPMPGTSVLKRPLPGSGLKKKVSCERL